jgi:hypothetical protein
MADLYEIVNGMKQMDVFELTGAATGIVGALLLAIKYRYSAWAWPIYIVSWLAWTAYAHSTHTYGLLTQQIIFTSINILGTWRWLFAAHLKNN